MSDDAPLAGLTVAVTAERRAEQQVRLLERRGATVRWAPVLRSVDLSENAELRAVTDQLVVEPPDVLVLLTGQGTSWWLEAADEIGTGEALRRALAGTTVLARGPKAAGAARRAGLDVAWQARNEVVSEVLERLSLDAAGQSVAVQLDGADDSEVLAQVEALSGRPATAVPVYRWDLPADRRPALELVRDIVDGRVDAVTFTASPAVRYLAQLANSIGQLEALDRAMSGRVRAVCVGPVCSAAARQRGWSGIVEPERFRLVPMIDALVDAIGATGR